eukprot:jgi/Botrbrau1/16546/Bobra.0256s0005.1
MRVSTSCLVRAGCMACNAWACQKRILIFTQASSSVQYGLMEGSAIVSAGWATIEFPDDKGAVEQEGAIMLDVVKRVKCTRVYSLPIPCTVHLLQNIQAWCPEPTAHKISINLLRFLLCLIEQCACDA